MNTATPESFVDAKADLDHRIDLCGDPSVQKAWLKFQHEHNALLDRWTAKLKEVFVDQPAGRAPFSTTALVVSWPIAVRVDHTVPPDEILVEQDGRIVARFTNVRTEPRRREASDE